MSQKNEKKGKEQGKLGKAAKAYTAIKMGVGILSLKAKVIILLVAVALIFSTILLVGIISLLEDNAREEERAANESSTNLAGGTFNFGMAQVSPQVEQYRGAVRKELEKYNSVDLLDVVLAQMMQESGGMGNDPMQASESKCGYIGCITNPSESIEQGVKYFISVYKNANKDIKLTLQSYNFGQGFIPYVKSRGGSYTKELAISFSQMMYQKLKHQGIYVCHRPSAIANNACYGDIEYVDAVMKYLPSATAGSGVIQATGEFKKVLGEMQKYEGWTYVFGGANPTTSFDCSGLMQWGFKKIGVNLPRTALQQYEYSKRIKDSEAKPGDLVFFVNTYKPGVSHVGVYLGNGLMYDTSGNPKGVGVKDITEGYWKQKFYAFGRVADFN